MILAAIFLALAALIGLAANPVAKWWARNEAATDRLLTDALDDRPDYDANEQWWAAQGRSQLR